MPVVTEERLRFLLAPYLQGIEEHAGIPEGLFSQLGRYLDLLVRWNKRTNLTAVRDPEMMVRRHFGESLFAGGVLAGLLGKEEQVLDLGSGSGFPGLPVQLLLPGAQVTLAESQGKKVAFLREVIRTLDLPTEVWAGRAESMEAGRKFNAVMLRAVDRMSAMVGVGFARVSPGGVLLEVTTQPSGPQQEGFQIPGEGKGFIRVTRVI